MKLLTIDAVLVCQHEQGVVRNIASQSLVTIEGRRVLVLPDPEGRPIGGCPNVGVTIKPCLLTLKVEAGYSDFMRVDGKPICLDTVTGLTEGTPPGTVKYRVRAAGQALVSQA